LAALSLGHDALPIDEAPMDDWVGAVNLENPSVAHLRGPEVIRSENLIKIKLLVDFLAQNIAAHRLFAAI
jgi:hypothetical protein